MDNYRRPRVQQKHAPQIVDGLTTPKQTRKAETNVQPYRRAVVQQQLQPRRSASQLPATPVKPLPQQPALDMSLPDGASSSKHYVHHAAKRGKVRKLAIKGSLATAALVLTVGGVLATQGVLNARKVFKGNAQSAASLQQNVNPNLLKGEGDGRINMLLTGIGGDKHAGGDLTDTLVVASIDPVNNTAALLSVPRDLWVTIPGKGSMKINAAYASAKYEYMRKNKVTGTDSQAINAGFVAIDQTLEQVLGVPINYNLLVNFQAFSKAVDTVGGVNITVPADLYDGTMAWENGGNPYLARAGAQTFDGKHALIYARSRETSSDFARSERQRAVLLALKQKTVSLGILGNPTKISGLVGAFGSNVQTDLSLGDASRLYSIIKKIDNKDIQSVSLAGTTSTTTAAAGSDGLVTTGTINSQSIVMPKAGLENYDAIQEFVHGKLRDGYIIKENAKILVVNGTVEAGLATRTADKLKSYGYNVVGTASTETEVYPTTQVINLSKNNKKYTKNYLQQRYNVTATSTLADRSIRPGTADFVVLLGSDASF